MVFFVNAVSPLAEASPGPGYHTAFEVTVHG